MAESLDYVGGVMNGLLKRADRTLIILLTLACAAKGYCSRSVGRSVGWFVGWFVRTFSLFIIVILLCCQI